MNSHLIHRGEPSPKGVSRRVWLSFEVAQVDEQRYVLENTTLRPFIFPSIASFRNRIMQWLPSSMLDRSSIRITTSGTHKLQLTNALRVGGINKNWLQYGSYHYPSPPYFGDLVLCRSNISHYLIATYTYELDENLTEAEKIDTIDQILLDHINEEFQMKVTSSAYLSHPMTVTFYSLSGSGSTASFVLTCMTTKEESVFSSLQLGAFFSFSRIWKDEVSPGSQRRSR
jgi:hypothetical protein